jgi:putative hydrolase of the HAD superfamily
MDERAATMHSFDKVREWIFDLDNTLYPPSARLFDQINRRMTDFIERELSVSRTKADQMRGELWRKHGATLTGLVAEHGINADAFLQEAHDIELDGLVADRGLAARIAGLPGRKLVHTNGSRRHAARVLAARGLEDVFDRVIAIEDTGLVPKPNATAYTAFLAATEVQPEAAAMIEDHAENLRQPKELGMVTVWLSEDVRQDTPSHVDHRARCVTSFLSML